MPIRQQFNYAALLIIALILATISAVMLRFWLEKQKEQFRAVYDVTVLKDQAAHEKPEVLGESLSAYSNLSQISLIIVIACFSLLCFNLAIFWRQHHATQRERQRFQNLFNAAPVMYHTLDPQWRITSVNQTECDVMNISSGNLIGLDFLRDIIAVQDQPVCQAFLERVAKVGSGNQECRWVRSDGSTLNVDMICTAEFDSSGKLLEILVCAEDITDREAANERVFFLSKILENMDDVVVVTDNQNRVQYVNLAAERLFLHPTSIITGQPIVMLFDSSRIGGLFTQIQDVINDGSIWQGDIPCLRQDGLGIVVAAKVSQLREPDGPPVAIIYTMSDITYQKHIMLELRQSEDKYRTIFDQAPLSVFLLDAHGTIVDINRWHIEHVDKKRKSRADYLTHNIFNIKFFTEAGLAPQLRDLLRGESFEISQIRFEIEADRAPLVMSVSGMPLFDDHHVVRGALLLLADVTERYDLQEQLWRHAVELEEKTRLALHSSRLKSEFLANVSHELRTPLNAIIGFTRLVMKKNKALIADAQFRNLQHILDSAYHLLDLINSILDLSKIEAGRMDLHIERFPFEPFLESIVKTAEPLMEKNNNLFIQKIDPSIQFVNNDMTKLRQVIDNLLSNAAKFTKQGTITLKTTHLEPPGEGLSPLVQIDVIDSGIGIPEEKVDDIFEAFHQADGSTTRQYGGTGLGLTLSKRFCILMRGSIAVNSVPSKGSTFTITIPVDYDKAGHYDRIHTQEEEIDRLDAMARGREVVLIVNNEPELTQQLRRIFSAERIIITGAANYAEALNKTQYLLPSLVFLDPWVDQERGWRFIRTLKTQRHTWNIPIILLSHAHDGSRTILPHFDAMFKPASDSRFQQWIESIQKKTNPRTLVVDDDVEYLNQAAENFMAANLPFDLARSYDEAYLSAMKKQPGALMLSLSNLDEKDMKDLKNLLEIKSIDSIIVIAWQRMSDKEFTTTIQNLRMIVDQYSIPQAALQAIMTAQIYSVSNLFGSIRSLTTTLPQ